MKLHTEETVISILGSSISKLAKRRQWSPPFSDSRYRQYSI